MTRVPLDADNYSGLAVNADALIYGVAPEIYYGRSAATKPSLRIFTFKDRKETTLVDEIGGFVVSRDGSKVLVRQEPSWNVYDATASGGQQQENRLHRRLDAGKDPVAEWNQIFNEVWRRYRDFFYAPNMHGYDWEALRQRYSQLLPYVAHRTDLELRDQRNDLRTDRAARLHRRRRHADSAAPARGPAGRAISRWTPDPGDIASPEFSPARTRKKSIDRR